MSACWGLERAGYVVDFLAGSSIGALIGSLMGLGLNADEIEVQLKRIWAPNMSTSWLTGRRRISLGLEHILDTIRDIVGDRMMSDLCFR
jgi:predicted acylesterase/phospholipase RssA